MNRAFRDAVRWKSSVANLQSSSKTLSASKIRKTFIDYFCEENGHEYIRSSPVFSLKDPTLAFTNAGMNQFKEVFLGLVEPLSKKVANSQKCIRIGGMHNDLEQVGENGRHHTFFEMLGNWSFGDYFKEESCLMSWELLTKVFNIPPERLYVTYFKGDLALGLGPDFEVKEIWRKIGVKENHILAFGARHNFWTGSVIGPCGPSTEIHYDHSFGVSEVGSLVNSNTNAITELWNLVFIQYDRKPDGKLAKLNRHFVDTGMGFERLVAILQGKISNYDTDLFLPLFEVIQNHTGHSGYTGEYGGNVMDTSYRVLADHSRMIAVALSDGMIPNHQSKVRGIIKRALKITENVFNTKADLIKELTTHVAESLSDAYPEIEKNLPKIHYIIDEEAELVKSKREKAVMQWGRIKKNYPALEDLDVRDTPQIIAGLDYISKNILKQGKKKLSSEDIFFLFETLGVPVDKTQLIAEKLDLQCDMEAYKNYLQSKKKTVKTEFHNKFLKSFNEYPYFNVLADLEAKQIQPTKDYFKYDYKVDANGKYIFEDQPITVEAILLDNNLVDEITPENIEDGKEIGVVLDRTHLFSEEAGQVSDFGTLQIDDIIFVIGKLVKIKNFVVHFGQFKNFPRNSKMAVKNVGILKIDENRRLSVMQNHTALHLLNAALRHELYVTGEKFSEVTPEKLQLNLMVYKDLPDDLEGIEKIEKLVKDFIVNKTSVERKLYPHQSFQFLNDVLFIPGETILEREVPVVEIDSGVIKSREYCTGTHVLNASHLQDFVITKYTKGSFSVHKIEAATGENCSQIRKADSEWTEKWACLQNKITGNVSEDLVQEVQQLFLEISQAKQISHITKFRLKSAIFEANTNLVTLFKTFVRNSIEEEIKKASSATSENFIVHVLESTWSFDPKDLETVASNCCDKPLIIFFRRKESLVIQSIVPKAFVSREFSARDWLMSCTNTLNGTAFCRKKQSSNLIFYTSELKCTEAQLRNAVDMATVFAKENIKTEPVP